MLTYCTLRILTYRKKHRLRGFLIDALTASSSTGTVLQEISERKNKSEYNCPDCESEHIGRFGIQLTGRLMEEGLLSQYKVITF